MNSACRLTVCNPAQMVVGRPSFMATLSPYIPPVPPAVTARIADSVSSLPQAEWDACAGTANPFVSHAFLATLEASHSVGHETGWRPLPIVVDGADGTPAAAAPAYVKTHSQGEYVFDHGWAEAWERDMVFPAADILGLIARGVGGLIPIKSDPAAPAVDYDFVFLQPNETQSISRTVFFPVTQAGAYTFNLRGQDVAGDLTYYRSGLTLVYLP